MNQKITSVQNTVLSIIYLGTFKPIFKAESISRINDSCQNSNHLVFMLQLPYHFWLFSLVRNTSNLVIIFLFITIG
jgi:hypothetical protein